MFLSPFDHLVTLPIFNPSSIIKTDKTYNFMKVEIPCDIPDKETGTRYNDGNEKSVLPSKLSDINLKFICGKITDQEDAKLDEKETLISIDDHLGLDSNCSLAPIMRENKIINQLVCETVAYYKTNNQYICLKTCLSKISDNIHVTPDNKRMILGNLCFDQSNEFKILNSFQMIFHSTKLEIRNECKTWIFNITDEETISLLKYLRQELKTKYFKNFLIEVDVSLIIDLEKMLIIITHEKSTKYKTFIELARHVGKLFEILKFIDIQTNQKMLKYLKHYRNSTNKTMLIFQIPLSSEHLNQNMKAVSFIINCPSNMQKIESQSTGSLSITIYPSFAQSFLVCALKRDITSIGSTLESLSRSADTLVEFNEYIMGRILYPSIMDGEDKYNLTFITRTRDEICIYYRDYFALEIIFPKGEEDKNSTY